MTFVTAKFTTASGREFEFSGKDLMEIGQKMANRFNLEYVNFGGREAFKAGIRFCNVHGKRDNRIHSIGRIAYGWTSVMKAA